MRSDVSKHLKLFYVTDRAANTDEWLIQTVEQAVKGGVTTVQLREKNISVQEIIMLGKALKALLKPYKVPLIINDNVEVCKAVGADGVHLGQSDMHPNEARKLLGEQAIIGLSLENMQQTKLANQLSSIDYVAASPVFKTPTKPECTEAWGLEGLRQLATMSRYPVIAIGGINLQNIVEVMDAGAVGIAVVSYIQLATNKQDAAVRLLKEIERCLPIARHLTS